MTVYGIKASFQVLSPQKTSLKSKLFQSFLIKEYIKNVKRESYVLVNGSD